MNYKIHEDTISAVLLSISFHPIQHLSAVQVADFFLQISAQSNACGFNYIHLDAVPQYAATIDGLRSARKKGFFTSARDRDNENLAGWPTGLAIMACFGYSV